MRDEVRKDEDGYRSVAERGNRRRMRALAGVVGLAALGTAAFLVTSEVSDNSENDRGDVADSVSIARDPVVPKVSTASSARTSPAPSSASSTTRTDKQRIRAARSAAAAHVSGPVRRPLTSVNGGPTITAADITRSVIGSTRHGGEEVLLYSAHQDLTGMKELAWVTGDHESVGDAECTNKIRLSPDVAAVERPTLLICWHTSATKSVYTVAVKMNGRPSKTESVAAIDQEWARLG